LRLTTISLFCTLSFTQAEEERLRQEQEQLYGGIAGGYFQGRYVPGLQAASAPPGAKRSNSVK
jgi:hypothetical protein